MPSEPHNNATVLGVLAEMPEGLTVDEIATITGLGSDDVKASLERLHTARWIVPGPLRICGCNQRDDPKPSWRTP